MKLMSNLFWILNIILVRAVMLKIMNIIAWEEFHYKNDTFFMCVLSVKLQSQVS